MPCAGTSNTRLVMITTLPIAVNMATGSIDTKFRRLGEEKTWASMRLIHQMTSLRPKEEHGQNDFAALIHLCLAFRINLTDKSTLSLGQTE